MLMVVMFVLHCPFAFLCILHLVYATLISEDSNNQCTKQTEDTKAAIAHMQTQTEHQVYL